MLLNCQKCKLYFCSTLKTYPIRHITFDDTSSSCCFYDGQLVTSSTLLCGDECKMGFLVITHYVDKTINWWLPFVSHFKRCSNFYNLNSKTKIFSQKAKMTQFLHLQLSIINCKFVKPRIHITLKTGSFMR